MADVIKSTEDATYFLGMLSNEDVRSCDEKRQQHLSQALAKFIAAMLQLEFVREELIRQKASTG